MKKSVSLILVLLLLVVIPAVSATTNIKLKTLPGHTAYINILEPKIDYQLIKVFKEYTNSEGKITVSFDEGSRTKVNVLVIIKKDDVRIDKETFENVPTGGIQELTLLPDDWIEPVVEVPAPIVEETTPVIEEPAPIIEEAVATEPESTQEDSQTDPQANAPITGEVVTENTKGKGYTLYFGLLIIIVAGLVLFIFGYKILKAKGVVPDNSHISFKPKKTKSVLETKTADTEVSVTDRLAAAEQKLKEAQSEINQIKNRDKIQAAERKLKEDQERLERMKQGYDLDEPRTNVKPFRDFGDKPKF